MHTLSFILSFGSRLLLSLTSTFIVYLVTCTTAQSSECPYQFPSGLLSLLKITQHRQQSQIITALHSCTLIAVTGEFVPVLINRMNTKQLVRLHHHNVSFTCKDIDNWERGLALKVVLVYAMKAHESV